MKIYTLYFPGDHQSSNPELRSYFSKEEAFKYLVRSYPGCYQEEKVKLKALLKDNNYVGLLKLINEIEEVYLLVSDTDNLVPEQEVNLRCPKCKSNSILDASNWGYYQKECGACHHRAMRDEF